jgi:hypothetical protein
VKHPIIELEENYFSVFRKEELDEWINKGKVRTLDDI